MLIHFQINVPQTLVCRMLIIQKTICVCQGGLVAYKKSLHLQLCNKLKAALRKSVHLYHTPPPKVQGSRKKRKDCKNQRQWMTTNCALDTAQQSYKWNDSSRDCTYKTSRRSSHTKPQHEAGRKSHLQHKSHWRLQYCWEREIFPFRDAVSERLPMCQ